MSIAQFARFIYSIRLGFRRSKFVRYIKLLLESFYLPKDYHLLKQKIKRRNKQKKNPKKTCYFSFSIICLSLYSTYAYVRILMQQSCGRRRVQIQIIISGRSTGKIIQVQFNVDFMRRSREIIKQFNIKPNHRVILRRIIILLIDLLFLYAVELWILFFQ